MPPGRPPISDEQLLHTVAAVEAAGSQVAAAKKLGLNVNTVHKRMKKALERGLLGGSENVEVRSENVKRKADSQAGRRPPTQREAEEATDWWAWIAGGRADDNLRNDLILRYLPTLEKIAYKRAMQLGGDISAEELVNVGVVGLIDAMRRFEPDRGLKFWTFAQRRVAGTINDWLRRVDHLSRDTRQHVQLKSRLRCDLMQQLGRAPTDDELQDAVQASGGDWEKATVPPIVSGDEPLATALGDREVTPLDLVAEYRQVDELENRELFRQLTRSLRMEEQTALYLYYHRQATMRQIGQVMRLSESRMSQLMSGALRKLRGELRGSQVAEDYAG